MPQPPLLWLETYICTMYIISTVFYIVASISMTSGTFSIWFPVFNIMYAHKEYRTGE